MNNRSSEGTVGKSSECFSCLKKGLKIMKEAACSLKFGAEISHRKLSVSHFVGKKDIEGNKMLEV